MNAEPREFADGFGQTVAIDTDGEHELVLGFCSNFREMKPVWYLHGALHFFREPGRLAKCVASEEQTVMGSIREHMADDLYPLLVLEGRDDQKQAAIDTDRTYLAKAFEALQTAEGPLVTYGFGLSQHDLHIAKAIAQNEDLTPVFIGVHNEAKLPEMIDTLKKSASSFDESRFRYFDSKSIDPWNTPEANPK